MKKTLLTLIFVFLAIILFAKREEYRREINREFNVSANSQLSISNIYGNVNIIEGNEGKIVFKIEIKGEGKNAETAKEYAEGVNVDFTSNSNHVSAKTSLPKISCSNCGISIDYVVVVPRSATMDFNLKYGNLTLNDTPKPLTIAIMYGNVKANILENAKLDAKYGDVKFEKCDKLNLAIKYGDLNATSINQADIDIAYGKIILGKCKDLLLKSRYTKLQFEEIASIKADSQYDKFTVKTVNEFTIATNYTTIAIDRLNGSFTANRFGYGNLTITDIANDFSKITIDNGAYSSIRLGLTEQHNAKANISAGKYGSIRSGKIKLNNVVLSDAKNSLVGNIGKSENPKSEVTISANYGNIYFQ
ncbi:MAG: hypothetical protein LBK94_11800 [Prevotellaceae bacterium]|jgi:hypothetical protein|nr:hypothetical protein [Prevotellaceae bacterium]